MSHVPPPNGAIEELSSALGEESARELVEIFLNSFETVLKELNSGDREQSRRAAHSLKSSSRIVGATALSNRMAELEARLANIGSEVTPEDVTATIAEFDQIAASLRAFVGRSGA